MKTGGIDAEYGGALGGVISAVTKSGGNMFTGEAHYYYIGNALSAGPVKRLVLDPVDFHDRRLLRGRQAGQQPERVRRIVRRPDREEPALLLRLGLTARGPAHERLQRSRPAPSRARSIRIRPRGRDSARSRTQPADVHCQRQRADDADALDRTAAGLRFDRHQLHRIVVGAPTKRIAHAGSRAIRTTSAATSTCRSRNSGYLSVRGGYFYDNYKDTGVPLTTSYTYQAPNFNVPGVPPSLQGPVEHGQHAAHSDQQLRQDHAGLLPARLQPRVHRPGLSPDQRRLGRSPLGQ